MISDLVKSFTDAFHAGLSAEMFAMQSRLGPYEVQLRGLREAEPVGKARAYAFDLAQSSDKIVAGMECSVRADRDEHPVRVLSVDGETIVVSSEGEIAAGSAAYALIVYPWFLTESLKSALIGLASAGDEYHVESGLRLFGKLPPVVSGEEPRLGEHALNDSQAAALGRSLQSSTSLVWGPPGTGKTTTLAAVIAEKLARGERVLVTSTTNAAIDQLLNLMVRRGDRARGEIVRIGESRAAPPETSLAELGRLLSAGRAGKLAHARERRDLMQALSKAAAKALAAVEKEASERQVDLFGAAKTGGEPMLELLRGVFGERRSRGLAAAGISERRAALSLRARRLELGRRLLIERIGRLREAEMNRASEVLAGARVVFSTLSNLWVSKHLRAERFDCVIVDEAGMAILPAIFYAACLARKSVVIAGDPKQLPAIIQAEEPFAQKVLARSIFDIAPAGEITLLDVQYRMSPQICRLVSETFYDGRLGSPPQAPGAGPAVDLPPFAGAPLVIVDTSGLFTCGTREGSFSRYNEGSAALCVSLAAEALEAGVRSIAVITPYQEQARRISAQLAPLGASPEELECATVHRFQGHERELVIFDAVDCHPLKPGILLGGGRQPGSAPNLINVSISRARSKLVMVADLGYFRSLASGGIMTAVLEKSVAIGALVAPASESMRAFA